MTRNQDQSRGPSGLTDHIGILNWAWLLGILGELGRRDKEKGLRRERRNILLTEILPKLMKDGNISH